MSEPWPVCELRISSGVQSISHGRSSIRRPGNCETQPLLSAPDKRSITATLQFSSLQIIGNDQSPDRPTSKLAQQPTGNSSNEAGRGFFSRGPARLIDRLLRRSSTHISGPAAAIPDGPDSMSLVLPFQKSREGKILEVKKKG